MNKIQHQLYIAIDIEFINIWFTSNIIFKCVDVGLKFASITFLVAYSQNSTFNTRSKEEASKREKKTASCFMRKMSAMRARGCATGLAAMSISQRRNLESTHQTTLALTLGLHNKAVPIFIELPLCRTGIGGSSPLPSPIFPVFPSRCRATARWKLSKRHELWTCVEKSIGFSAKLRPVCQNRWINGILRDNRHREIVSKWRNRIRDTSQVSSFNLSKPINIVLISLFFFSPFPHFSVSYKISY